MPSGGDARTGLALYLRLVGARVRSQMQYKFSFAVLTLMGVVNMAVDFIMVLVIFGRIPSLGGWALSDVALLYGMAYTSFSLAEGFARGFDSFSRQVREGTFDRVLTRPLGAFFQVLASEFPLWKFGKVFSGLAFVYVAQRSLGLSWTPERLGVLGVAILCGAAIFFCIFVIGAAACFWTVQTNEIVNIFTNGGVTLTMYPLDIFDAGIRRAVTFVIPLAFIDYYPALFLLGRPDSLRLPPWIGLLSPLASAALGVVAWAAWSLGVRHYSSVGH